MKIWSANCVYVGDCNFRNDTTDLTTLGTNEGLIQKTYPREVILVNLQTQEESKNKKIHPIISLQAQKQVSEGA